MAVATITAPLSVTGLRLMLRSDYRNEVWIVNLTFDFDLVADIEGIESKIVILEV